MQRHKKMTRTAALAPVPFLPHQRFMFFKDTKIKFLQHKMAQDASWTNEIT